MFRVSVCRRIRSVLGILQIKDDGEILILLVRFTGSILLRLRRLKVVPRFFSFVAPPLHVSGRSYHKRGVREGFRQDDLFPLKVPSFIVISLLYYSTFVVSGVELRT